MRIRAFMKKNYLLIALLLVTVFFAVATKGKLFYSGNVKNLFLQNMYVYILASGMLCFIFSATL